MTTPILDSGRIQSTVRLAEARKGQLFSHQQAVQPAFREASDALAAVRKNRDYRERQDALRTPQGRLLILHRYATRAE